MCRLAPAFGAGDARGVPVHLQLLENRPAIITFVAIEWQFSPLSSVVGSLAMRLLTNFTVEGHSCQGGGMRPCFPARVRGHACG